MATKRGEKRTDPAITKPDSPRAKGKSQLSSWVEELSKESGLPTAKVEELMKKVAKQVRHDTERCVSCGRQRSDHNVRHPFVSMQRRG